MSTTADFTTAPFVAILQYYHFKVCAGDKIIKFLISLKTYPSRNNQKLDDKILRKKSEEVVGLLEGFKTILKELLKENKHTKMNNSVI